MRIVVAGTRGFPDVQGGIETHCRHLYPRMAAAGDDVTVICRRPYMTYTGPRFEAVNLLPIWSPRGKRTETIVHTFLAVIKARSLNPEILHIHACGPALLTPLARLLGMRVAVTLHGADYERAKWGRMARAMLRLGEWCAVRFANSLITLSEPLADDLRRRYGREEIAVIPNGVCRPEPVDPSAVMNRYGIMPGKYVIAVGRLVEEKGFHFLIDAWRRLNLRDYKLVIAGGADHEDAYSRRLTAEAREAGVVMTGRVDHATLAALYSGAALFCMPSTHEGLPIALLEAMSHGLDVAVSNIGPCMLPELEADDHFESGNVEALATLIGQKLDGSKKRSYDMGRYDWDNVTALTRRAYR